MSVFSYCMVNALGFGTFYRQNDKASSAARILSLQKSLSRRILNKIVEIE